MSVPAAAVLDLIDECGLDFSLAFRWDNHQLFFSAADLLMILPPIFKRLVSEADCVLLSDEVRCWKAFQQGKVSRCDLLWCQREHAVAIIVHCGDLVLLRSFLDSLSLAERTPHNPVVAVVVHDSLSHDSVLEQWMEMFAAFTPAQQIRVVSSLLHQLSLDSRFSILSQFQPNTRSPIRVPRTFVGAERLGPRQRRDREAQAWNYLKRLAAGKRSESPAQAPSEPPLQRRAVNPNLTCEDEEMKQLLAQLQAGNPLDADLVSLLDDICRSHRCYIDAAQKCTKPVKNRTSARQRLFLLSLAEICSRPTSSQLSLISSAVCMGENEVRRWFQNVRAVAERDGRN